jgi:hypothetical protein
LSNVFFLTISFTLALVLVQNFTPYLPCFPLALNFFSCKSVIRAPRYSIELPRYSNNACLWQLQMKQILGKLNEQSLKRESIDIIYILEILVSLSILLLCSLCVLVQPWKRHADSYTWSILHRPFRQ